MIDTNFLRFDPFDVCSNKLRMYFAIDIFDKWRALFGSLL